MPRSVSIRRSLLTNLLALVGLLGAAIFGTTFLGSRSIEFELSSNLMDRSADRTEAELNRFFESVNHALEVARGWGERGLLSLEDPEKLRHTFAPVLSAHPRISAAIVADENGREYLLRLREGVWLERRMRRDEWGDRAELRAWPEGGEVTETEERADYDPRKRPWYRGAAEAGGEAFWTPPYTFFISKLPGVTVATTFDVGDGVERVLGFDVLLSDVSAFTTSFRLSERGMVFVLTEDARLIGLPGAPLFPSDSDREGAMLRDPAELGIPLLTDAATAARAQQIDDEVPLRFESGGEAWWLRGRRFRVGASELTIAVLVPEVDIVGGLRRQRLFIAAAVAAALVLAALQAVLLARRYSRPIEVLVGESDRIGRGELDDPAEVPSSVLEIDRLAAAQHEMRSALRSLLKLEGDLQVARQIQEAALPTEMPQVEGYEIDAWSDPAEETGGDTYDVIGMRSRGRAFVSERADVVVLLLADATGHGVGPALQATQVRSMLRMATRLDTDLSSFARHLNEQLCDDLHGGRFVTVWLGLLDARENTVESFSGGQAPILWLRAAEDRVESLEADTAAFGVVRELEAIEPTKLRMERGDVLAVMSDGIFDARNAAGETFGEKRVMELLRTRRDASASALLEALRGELARFCGETPASDDRTAVVVKRL